MPDKMPTNAEAGARPSRADFGAIIEAQRRALKLHCYRMLGSLHEAEDAVQETMLRAWRGFDAFEARASTKNWLFKIATNTSLNIIEARTRRNRVSPERLGGPAIERPTGKPDVEAPWVEPFPDGEIESIADPEPGPDARYELREAVRLAFVAAIQELPPRQRAALLLADVMGWSAIEVAAVLDTSVASVNSALQRARATLAAPQREAGEAASVNEQDRALLQRYVTAWESRDLEKFVALLKDDATYAMPPWREWYSGRASIGDFFRSVWSAYRGFRLVPTGANLQPAFGLYALRADGRWSAHSLQLLTLEQGEIATFTAYMQPLANRLFSTFQLPLVLEA